MDKNNSGSGIFRFVGIIIVVFVAFLFYSKMSSWWESDYIIPNVLEDLGLVRGESLNLTGFLYPSDDISNYTHILENDEYGEIGLRSSTVNISAYSDYVQIRADVWGVVGERLVLSVREISLLLDEEDIEDEENELVSSIRYINSAGIVFNQDFWEKYKDLNTNRPGEISFSSIDDKGYKINYFVCRRNSADQDCNALNQTRSQSSSKSFNTAAGVTFYKLSEVDSWFASNGELWGYFFHDISEQDLLDLSRRIKFPTIKNIENDVLPSVRDICRSSDARLSTFDDYYLELRSGVLYLIVNGLASGNDAVCELIIDYNNASRAVLASFDFLEDEGFVDIDEEVLDTQDNADETSVSSTSNATSRPIQNFDINVTQFPINLERPFVFQSNRGHTISFPSMNISFVGEHGDVDTGLLGARCYAKIYVISYPDRDFLKDNPSLIIYECSSVPSQDVISMDYIIYPLVENKSFIIHILDSSWWDFANNIVIEASL